MKEFEASGGEVPVSPEEPPASGDSAIAAPVEAAAEPPAEAATPPAPEVKSAPLDKSFEKLAQEKAAFRAEQERMKPYVAALQKFDPNTLQALVQAADSGDPAKVLRALKMEVPTPSAEAPEPPDELTNIKQEIAELRKFRAEQAEEKLLGQIKQATADKKFITGRNAHKMVLQYILDYKDRQGYPPGDTLEESYAVASEAVERHLQQEAEGWRKLLTPDAPVVESSQTPQPRVTEPQPLSKSLTNAATAAPPHSVTTRQPKTPEEYQALALEEAKKLFGW